jgi:lipopolysaccharide biosynthesis regulator YciM
LKRNFRCKQLIATQEVLNELKQQEVTQKETLQHLRDFYKFEEEWKKDEDDLNDTMRDFIKELRESK